MGYSFISWLLFYFLLVEARHCGEKRVQDGDWMLFCQQHPEVVKKSHNFCNIQRKSC